MALQVYVEEATIHFLRSQFAESLRKLQDAMDAEPSKMPVVLQCLLANDSVLCRSQLTGGSVSSADSMSSFENVMLPLRGVPASQNQAVVDCIIQYNQLITRLCASTDSHVRANAISVVHAIEEYLKRDILQTLDDAAIPLVVMRSALVAARILAGMDVTDWLICGGDDHSCHKDSWCTAMLLPTGCKVPSVSEQATTGESLSLKGVLSIMKCVRACQNQSWGPALKIIKHSQRMWTGNLAAEMKYVKAFCYYQLASFEAAERCLSSLPPECGQSLKDRAHLLIACCLAKQGKYHLAISEMNQVLSGVSHDTLVLPLLNLSALSGKLGNHDTELAILDQLVKVSGQPLKPTDCPLLTFHPTVGQELSVTEMELKALYRIASRSLQLQRFQEASERYLDLISLLEDIPIIKLGSGGNFPVTLPSTTQIYLEAASSILEAGKYEEAAAICETIISRTAGLRVTSGARSNPSGGIHAGGDPCAGDRTSTSRARRKDPLDNVESSEESNCVSQGGPGSNMSRMNMSGSSVCRFASLCLIRSECLFKLRNLEGSLESLDDTLVMLDGYSCSGQPAEESLLHPTTAKRRKLGSDGTHTDVLDQPTDGVSLLRGRAYNNKGLILIGRGRLNDALAALLSSLEYNPGNADARKNLCLLLFKMGRKKEAYTEWRKMSVGSP